MRCRRVDVYYVEADARSNTNGVPRWAYDPCTALMENEKLAQSMLTEPEVLWHFTQSSAYRCCKRGDEQLLMSVFRGSALP